jgi:hypothetical protein
MKKNLLKFSWLLIVALLTFTACNDDDDNDGNNNNPDVPQVEDGFYLKGAATALTELNSKGIMKITSNEVTKEDRAELLEIYVAVKGGNDGFNIVEVTGATQKTYGPGSDFAVVGEDARDNDEPKVDFWRGSYAETTDKFTVPEDGLYHVVIDKELKKVVVAPVVWGVIGAATPGGWGESTQLSATFDLNKMTFQGTDIPLSIGDYKFRYSNGWKIILDTDLDVGGGDKGVKVNTNFGGAVDNLVPGGANINNATTGKYTITITWELGKSYVASLEKTGENDLNDYTDTELGFVGSGIIAADTVLGWNVTIDLKTPAVNNTVYTWNWTNIQVTNADNGSFKIREGQDWNGVIIGYPQVTMTGDAADKFETNDDGNFVPTQNGTYDFTLVVDAATETYALTVNAAAGK